MKFSSDEKKYVDLIKTHSGQDLPSTRSVLKGLQITAILSAMGVDREGMEQIEFNDDEVNFIVPGICELKISHTEYLSDGHLKFSVSMEATPTEDFEREYERIKNGDVTMLEKYANRGIYNQMVKLIEDEKTIDLYEDEDEEDTV